MNLETAIRAKIIAASTTASSRVYELILPPTAAMPAVVLQRVTNVGHTDINIDFPRLQVSCWGSTPIQARALVDEITELLHNFKGIITGQWGQIRIKRCTMQPSIGVINDRESGLIHIPVDFKILYVKE